MGRAFLLQGDYSKDASRKPEDDVRGQADTMVCEAGGAGAEQSRAGTAPAPAQHGNTFQKEKK